MSLFVFPPSSLKRLIDSIHYYNMRALATLQLSIALYINVEIFTDTHSALTFFIFLQLKK